MQRSDYIHLWCGFVGKSYAPDLALLSVDVRCSFLPDEIIRASGGEKFFIKNDNCLNFA
jgi:hypothetical protein